LPGQQRRRGAVGLGEDDVEADRAGAEILQRPHEIGERVARPRPLADPRQAGIVDVDDHDRLRRLPGRQPLQRVEGEQPRAFERLGAEPAGGEQAEDRGEPDQRGQKASPGEGHCAGPGSVAASGRPAQHPAKGWAAGKRAGDPRRAGDPARQGAETARDRRK
jgi:hypothetical protein